MLLCKERFLKRKWGGTCLSEEEILEKLSRSVLNCNIVEAKAIAKEVVEGLASIGFL